MLIRSGQEYSRYLYNYFYSFEFFELSSVEHSSTIVNVICRSLEVNAVKNPVCIPVKLDKECR